MVKESDNRRRIIAATLVKLETQITIYDAGRRYRTDRERRSACLEALIKDAAQRDDRMLVLEQDDSLVSWDNQTLIEHSRLTGCSKTLHYEHRRASAEHLLAAPDAVAWCWAKGGEWRQRVRSIVAEVREV